MDGIHDLGGRQGFGPVDVDEPEEQFHAPWEARVRGMVNSMSRAPDWNIDWFRHCRELIDPIDYLQRPYFDQWVQTYAAMMVNSGLATVDELASGRAVSRPEGLSPPMTAEQARRVSLGARRFEAPVQASPRFDVGARVRTLAHGIPTHTRLPGYARGRTGRVHAQHGAHVMADDNALGTKVHEHLYTVSFDAVELWPEASGRRDVVLLNLWERYLEPA
ncbi:MAG: nitrile hydratase subunit beta [Ectothiorhodospiraceae bacterium]|nr:nitrile hydratase subunit beta [Ectothiorhodospiraceae bacterium]